MCSPAYVENWNHWRKELEGSLQIIKRNPSFSFQCELVAKQKVLRIPGPASSHFASQPTDLTVRTLRLQHIRTKRECGFLEEQPVLFSHSTLT